MHRLLTILTAALTCCTPVDDTTDGTEQNNDETGEDTGETGEENGDDTGGENGDDTGDDDTDDEGDETGSDTGDDTTGEVVLGEAGEQCSEDSECSVNLTCVQPGHTPVHRGLCAPACEYVLAVDKHLCLTDIPGPYDLQSICVRDGYYGTFYCAIDASATDVCAENYPEYNWERFQPWPGFDDISVCAGADEQGE